MQSFVFLNKSATSQGGVKIKLVLEILPYDFLLDDEGVNTFFEREHLKN